MRIAARGLPVGGFVPGLLAEAGPFEIGYAFLAIAGGLFVGMALLVWFSNKSRLDAELSGTPAASQLEELNRKCEQRVEEHTSAHGDRLDELTQQAEDLRRSNAELEEFAYVASHDLQEPLRMIGSYTQLLARRYGDRLDGAAKEYIDFAVDGAARMQRLINGLLAYSRVETRAGETELTHSGEVVDRVLKDLRGVIEDTGAVVTRDELPDVWVDAANSPSSSRTLWATRSSSMGRKPLECTFRPNATVRTAGGDSQFPTTGSGSNQRTANGCLRSSSVCILATNIRERA